MRVTSFILAVCAAAWLVIAVPTFAAKGGGGGGAVGPSPSPAPVTPNFPSGSSRSFSTDHSWHHHHNHGFFVGGWWYGPGYYDPWWDYPPPPYYGYGYQFSPPARVSQTGTNAPAVSNTYTTGYLWGMDRRLRLASKKDVRKVLADWWPSAPPEAREDFQRGFLEGYGPGGAEEFGKLLEKSQK